jgi:DNA-binding PadR family transcriptional regulator
MRNTGKIMNDSNLEKLTQELRRGIIPLAVLSQLAEEQYGYSLIQLLADKGLQVEQGTLYPLLRRLESHGLLESTWNVEGSRPRRYYRISPKGQALLPILRAEWKALVKALENM